MQAMRSKAPLGQMEIRKRNQTIKVMITTMTNLEHAKHATYVVELGVLTNNRTVMMEGYTYSMRFVKWADVMEEPLKNKWHNLLAKAIIALDEKIETVNTELQTSETARA